MLMDQAELIVWLERQISRYGTKRNFCREMDILPQQLCDALKGNRPVPKRLLRSLNVETVVRFRLKEKL